MRVVTLSGLADGLHVLETWAVDAAGNAQSAQFDNVTVVVDTVAPVIGVVQPLPRFTNASMATLCVNVTDASPINVSIVVGAAVSATNLSASSLSADRCWLLNMTMDGNRSVVVAAFDAAGNAAALSLWTLLDRRPPNVTSIRVLAPCVADVCGSGDASSLELWCNSSSTVGVASTNGTEEAPCSIQWAVVLNATVDTGSCLGSTSLAVAAMSNWTSLPAAPVPVTLLPTADVAASVLPRGVKADGRFDVYLRAVDAAGNTGPLVTHVLWVDSTPPPPPVLNTTLVGIALAAPAVAKFDIVAALDDSPGTVTLWYRHRVGNDYVSGADFVRVPRDDVEGSLAGGVRARLYLGDLLTNAEHTLVVRTHDVLNRQSANVTHSWWVLAAAPSVIVLQRPAGDSPRSEPSFVFKSSMSAAESARLDTSLSFEVQLDGSAGVLGTWHDPCAFEVNADRVACQRNCSADSGTAGCRYHLRLSASGSYALLIRVRALGVAGNATLVRWRYVVCSQLEFSQLDAADDSVTCMPCPEGGNCASAATPPRVVELRHVVSQRGWWAADSSDGRKFYRCPVAGSCVPGNRTAHGTGSRSECAKGYRGILCDVCADGYTRQLDECRACSASGATSIAVTAAIAVACLAAAWLCYRVYGKVARFLPDDVSSLMIGVSALQIVAAASSAYDVPWPSSFQSFAARLQWLLLDVVLTMQTDCSAPMRYYASMLVTLVCVKVAVLLLVAVPWLWHDVRHRPGVEWLLRRSDTAARCVVAVLSGCRRRRGCCSRRAAQAGVRRDADNGSGGGMGGGVAMSTEATHSRSHHSLPVTTAPSGSEPAQTDVRLPGLHASLKRSLWLLTFVYPGVSLTLLRMFKCRFVDGRYWLAADMRLECFTSEWAGFAVYALVMCVVYVVGLPVMLTWLLWRRRHHLYTGIVHRGVTAHPEKVAFAQSMYGFLYLPYGPTAWCWAAEEMLRKLLLTAMVALLDDVNSLQTAVAVVVCCAAHVIHAMWTPWGPRSIEYGLQHAALALVSVLFLVGLLLKVDATVSSTPRTAHALSGLLITLVIAFVVVWIACVVWTVVASWRRKRRDDKAAVGGDSTASGVAAPRRVPWARGGAHASAVPAQRLRGALRLGGFIVRAARTVGLNGRRGHHHELSGGSGGGAGTGTTLQSAAVHNAADVVTGGATAATTGSTDSHLVIQAAGVGGASPPPGHTTESPASVPRTCWSTDADADATAVEIGTADAPEGRAVATTDMVRVASDFEAVHWKSALAAGRRTSSPPSSEPRAQVLAAARSRVVAQAGQRGAGPQHHETGTTSPAEFSNPSPQAANTGGIATASADSSPHLDPHASSAAASVSRPARVSVSVSGSARASASTVGDTLAGPRHAGSESARASNAASESAASRSPVSSAPEPPALSVHTQLESGIASPANASASGTPGYVGAATPREETVDLDAPVVHHPVVLIVHQHRGHRSHQQHWQHLRVALEGRRHHRVEARLHLQPWAMLQMRLQVRHSCSRRRCLS
jgi:hypothetical protein